MTCRSHRAMKMGRPVEESIHAAVRKEAVTFCGALSPKVSLAGPPSGTKDCCLGDESTWERLDYLKAGLRRRRKERVMQVVYERCCGLDVHKDTVAACIAITRGGRVDRDKRVFGTTTKALLELSDWLAEHCVTHVGMESTGVYWKPI